VLYYHALTRLFIAFQEQALGKITPPLPAGEQWRETDPAQIKLGVNIEIPTSYLPQQASITADSTLDSASSSSAIIIKIKICVFETLAASLSHICQLHVPLL